MTLDKKKKKNTHCMQSINDEANNIIIRSRIVSALIKFYK